MAFPYPTSSRLPKRQWKNLIPTGVACFHTRLQVACQNEEVIRACAQVKVSIPDFKSPAKTDEFINLFLNIVKFPYPTSSRLPKHYFDLCGVRRRCFHTRPQVACQNSARIRSYWSPPTFPYPTSSRLPKQDNDNEKHVGIGFPYPTSSRLPKLPSPCSRKP